MEEGFPTDGSLEDKLNFLIRYAILAPSLRNSQPWNFRVEDGAINLFLDNSRARRTTDPELRELIISCGAALLHLCVAARKFGYDLIVEKFPDAGSNKANLLATVRLGGRKPPKETDTVMFYAIHKWLNVPRPFRENKRVPDALLGEMNQIANTELTWLYLARTGSSRDVLAGLVATGDVEQRKVEENRKKQIATAAHSKRRGQDKNSILKMDVAKGAGHVAAYFQSFLSRPLGESGEIAKKKKQLAMAEPVLAILGTYDNTPEAWLAAGEALATALLRGMAIGVRASFLNNSVQMPELRDKLVKELKLEGYPQIIFRLGFPDNTQTVRTPASDAVKQDYL
jgi:hypothetical protein